MPITILKRKNIEGFTIPDLSGNQKKRLSALARYQLQLYEEPEINKATISEVNIKIDDFVNEIYGLNESEKQLLSINNVA